MLKQKQICRIFEVMFSITHPTPAEDFEDVDDETVEEVLDGEGDIENVSVTVACEEPLSLCEFAQRLEAAKFQILAERDLLADDSSTDGTEVDILAIEDISHTNLTFLPAATDPKADTCEEDEDPIPVRLTATGIRVGGNTSGN